jgi:hypothetical protein
MAQPPRRLRPARRSGLTSPDPVRTATARTATRPPALDPRNPDKPHNSERQDACARIYLAKLLVQQSGRKQLAVIDRWIEA